jgi:ketosteroid isomerase-like protein
MDRDRLEARAREFTEAFNRNDLDAVMAGMTADAVYVEYDGTRRVGQAEVRAAFEPQFRGDFGRMRFDEEDIVVDPATGKVMISWTCHLETRRGPAAWRGLDLLHFDEAGKVRVKETYAKARQLRLLA